MADSGSKQPRYEAHESPSLLASLGFGAQFSLIASATLLVTPVVVAKASGRDDSFLVWVVFASLLVAGVSTLVQVRGVGLVGSGSMLPMFTAAFSIPFCISAVSDGGPATLAALVIVCGLGQIVISKWLFILRRIVTPVVGGTVLMILSITLASVVPRLLPEASESDALGAHIAALATLGVVSALILRGSVVVRLWGPIIGILAGCAVASRLRPLRCRVCVGGRVGRNARGMARVGLAARSFRHRSPVLDTAARLPVPQRDHIHTGQRRVHSSAAGIETRRPGRELSRSASHAGRDRCDQPDGRNRRDSALHRESGDRGLHPDHRGRFTQGRVLHRRIAHCAGIPAQGVRAAQLHTGFSDGGLSDCAERISVYRRRADRHPERAKPAKDYGGRSLFLDRRGVPV